MDLETKILQFIISGVMVGSIYAIISIGFNIVFNATDAINFAHGEFVMLGGMTVITLFNVVKLPLWASFFLSVAGVTLVAMILERTTIHYQQERQVINLIILTLGWSIFLRGTAMLSWGKDSFDLPSFSGSDPILFWGATLLPQALWIVGIGLVISVGLHLFFKYSLVGRAMKACSFDRVAARLVGIDDNWMVLISFAMAAATGSIAGIIITPISLMAYDQGGMLGLKGFCATFLGGLGNLYGSIIGGLLLGILESLGAGLISSGYKDAISFTIFLFILFFKPSGLLGERIRELSNLMKNFLERRQRNQYIYLLLFAIGIFFFPLFVKSKYFLNVMVFSGIHTIIVVGFCLLMGYAGQVSLGHAALFGLGAYSSGVLTVKFGFNPWVAFGAGIFIVACIAWIIGIPSLRLKGHYLAMATLGFGIIIQIILTQWRSLTEGTSGLVDIPGISIGGLKFNTDFKYYYFVWVFAVAAILLSLNIVQSRVGRALKALNKKETGAEAMGVNIEKYKIQIFVISSIYASVAGTLYTHYVNFLSPEGFSFTFSVLILVMAVFGGLTNIWGAVVGALSLTILPEFLRAYKDYDIIIYGVILILVMMFMPNGITGLVQSAVRWIRAKWLVKE